jgi:superfamily I DNA/RNA helicase
MFKKKVFIPLVESKGFAPTVEQVFNKDLVASGKNVKIVAGAGSGKSSSLRYTASSIPEKNFLVLCFNKANAKESNEHPDRPDNIFYSTIHSLAYKEIVDSSYRKKLKYLSWNDLDSKSIDDIIEHYPLNEKDSKKLSSLLTKECLNSVNLFCRSAGTDILDFVSKYLSYQFTTTDKHMAEFVLTDDDIIDLATIVYNYWLYITNKKSEGTISHDVYLKLYDLSKFLIEQVWDDRSKSYISIDVVCLDEAQDTNPVSESIFARQEMQKVLVGDPMQQLYAWRGAGDCMNKFNNFSIGYLTESFRFNSSIAAKANRVLELSGSSMRLTGSSTKTAIVTYAHLCRTNASVLEAIFGYLDSGKKVYTSIDLSDTFSKLYHIQACFFNQEPKYPNKELSAITDRVSLEKALEFSEELGRLQNISKKLTAGGTLFEVKKRLDSVVVKVPSDADIVITTIHASKGMEYSHVVIDDDILVIGKEESVQEALDRLFDTESLRCMLYVAITRAQVEVVLPLYFKNVFKPFDINTFSDTKDAKNDYCDYIGADTW